MNTRNTFKILALALLMASCGSKNCHNKFTVFDLTHYQSPEYKKALADMLPAINQHQPKYHVLSFEEREGKLYMLVEINDPGQELCAKVELPVQDDPAFASIVQAKGKGYSGALLEGLEISPVQEPGKLSFKIDRVSKIVD